MIASHLHPLDDVVRIEVRHLALPVRRPLITSLDDGQSDRQLVVVGLESSDGTTGWGECSALNAPGYTPEWAADSFDRLVIWADGGDAPDPDNAPLTFAAIEMSRLDLGLRSSGQSLASALGVGASSVRAGATIGLAPVGPSVELALGLVELGYRKLKVKIDPSQVDEVAHELTHVFEHRSADIEVHVDANGSLDAEHLMALAGLAWHGVTAIEQPFGVDRPDLAAELMLGTDAVVVADEAVRSVADADALHRAHALRAVAIKPPCLGGIEPALALLDWCRTNGVGASLGGMLESGLGRHALAAVGALDGFTLTGDLSPANQWLAADPWPDIEMVGPDVTVPSGPGVAPPPDDETLDRFSLRRSEHRRPLR